jgi:hypothetical protein
MDELLLPDPSDIAAMAVAGPIGPPPVIPDTPERNVVDMIEVIGYTIPRPPQSKYRIKSKYCVRLFNINAEDESFASARRQLLEFQVRGVDIPTPGLAWLNNDKSQAFVMFETTRNAIKYADAVIRHGLLGTHIARLVKSEPAKKDVEVSQRGLWRRVQAAKKMPPVKTLLIATDEELDNDEQVIT